MMSSFYLSTTKFSKILLSSRLLTAGLGLPLLIGCGASEDKVQAEFEAYVAERQDCTDDDECMARGFDCPLGCTTVFNKKHEADIEKKAERLIRRYEAGGVHCDYSCTGATTPPTCNAGTCSLE